MAATSGCSHSRQVTIHVSASRSFQSTQSILLTGLETRRELIKSREASAIEQRGPGRLVIRAPHNPLRPCHLLPAPRGPSPGDRQAATPSGPRSPLLDHLAPRLPPVTFLESAGRSHSPLAPSTCLGRGVPRSHTRLAATPRPWPDPNLLPRWTRSPVVGADVTARLGVTHGH